MNFLCVYSPFESEHYAICVDNGKFYISKNYIKVTREQFEDMRCIGVGWNTDELIYGELKNAPFVEVSISKLDQSKLPIDIMRNIRIEKILE